MTEFDVVGFKTAVEKHWNYHGPCRHRLWSSGRIGDVMQFEAAPVFQEILGGDQDGLRVWTAFSMNASNWFSEPGLGVRGKYKGRPCVLMILLEPIPDSETGEIIDSIKNETRSIKERQL